MHNAHVNRVVGVGYPSSRVNSEHSSVLVYFSLGGVFERRLEHPINLVFNQIFIFDVRIIDAEVSRLIACNQDHVRGDVDLVFGLLDVLPNNALQ